MFGHWQRFSRTRSDEERVVLSSIATAADSPWRVRSCAGCLRRGWACGPRRSSCRTEHTANRCSRASVRPSNLRFNCSHSDDVAAYAFSPGREIGIDIESVRTIHDAEDIAARFFSRREYEAYLALEPRDRPLGFFNCWTRKEAFVKALGDGLDYPLDRFDVTLAPGEPAKILRVENTPGDHCGWTLHSFVPGPGLIGALVVQKPAPRGWPQRCVCSESQCARCLIVKSEGRRWVQRLLKRCPS